MSIGERAHKPVVDLLHGVAISDPYRWLEDRNAVDTEKWIAEQQCRHDAYFSGIAYLDIVRRRVRDYLNEAVTDQPARAGGYYFYRRRRKDEEQPSICMFDLATNHETILVNPSLFGQFASVTIHCIAADGSLLAYELRDGGSDSKAIHILDLKNGRTLTDHLASGLARGFIFSPDNCGFYYCHEATPTSGEHTICFHPFGRSARDDRVLFRIPRAPRSRLILTADEVNLGAIFGHEHCGELVVDFYIMRIGGEPEWTLVSSNNREPYSPILTRGRIFVITAQDAPQRKVVEIAQNGATWRIVVPEDDATLQQVVLAGDKLYVNYLNHLTPIVRYWTLDGTEPRDVKVPIEGTIQLLPNLSNNTASIFYTHESFVDSPYVTEFVHATDSCRAWSRSARTTPPLALRARTIRYPAKDGAEIPMTIVMRNDLDPTSPHPTIITGYGGFGASVTPRFSVLVAVMLRLGTVFALPNIRGGSEFGKRWHDAAKGRNRQVAFDDFIAAAEWLCGQGFTIPTKLGIFGGSNSGLLVAAVMTQRPDLFQAVLCIAPLLDMVRFEQIDRAHRWQDEYGRVENVEDFNALLAYSPYHKIRDNVNYPSTLFVTGDKDERCNPAHARKMTARLVHRHSQRNPVLLDYSAHRGHSAALPLSVRVDALSRRITFLCKELGIYPSIENSL